MTSLWRSENNRTEALRKKAPRTKGHRMKAHLFFGGTGQNLFFGGPGQNLTSFFFFFDKADESLLGVKWAGLNGVTSTVESMFTRLTKNQGQTFRGCAEMFAGL